MKRTYLSGLIVASALTASPVFAADDLCEVNMQKLNDAKTTSMQLGDPAKSQYDDAYKAAMAAHAAKDEKACISHSTDAMNILMDAQKSKG
ncbi:hypothetical protein [Pseudomonas sp. CFBP 13719]|uniref:hypothetical protein n=1 Tax=Pseudomonas sp. CFBP 13719 TaxID=2775303 RepID=UPI00177D82A2|nr:hypothetical protein [Pseudomonas sp. CFBP 13719]MBD8685034.1 hypothetical protein [Pseudomonas sp. CFBP 13719]